MNAEMKKLVVEKINAQRKVNYENQVASIALSIQQQLDYMKNNEKSARQNIENCLKQLEILDGNLGEPLSAEDIFGKESK